ncbi:SDR family NAD(P)-dependent oxidoreductase [Pontibacter vulgaris]|uniref:SDR family NAD(P)-dependent oxidoreductase n=1 Tax=Pontibacter vulgaris TaxID=2905679 RepID=UPI001FA7C3ED|nr:SDR family oxidoreductase [Pontibacter vulgaris]
MVTYDFKEKVVLVTGGSSGLGRATAQSFAESGAIVIIASRDPGKAQETMASIKGEVEYIQTDLSKMDQVDSLMSQIRTQFGRLDIVINCAAGDSGIGKTLEEFAMEEFDSTININLKSMWLVMKHAIALMKTKSPAAGHIVNVSSVNGLGGIEYGSLYAATKAAVISLSKSAALELANTNIEVDVISPGAFDTPLLRKAMEMQTDGDPAKLQQVREKYMQSIPAGRIGTPEEFARTVLWICSEKPSYLFGNTFIIDGGMTSRMR